MLIEAGGRGLLVETAGRGGREMWPGEVADRVGRKKWPRKVAERAE
jgi:hypothetical protein